ncbi:hypothetical protein A2U01_0092685, partial [Trifolium medium]|nr:hypothetical protein [Trifolium medium]
QGSELGQGAHEESGNSWERRKKRKLVDSSS